jgi:hypothetical protein
MPRSPVIHVVPHRVRLLDPLHNHRQIALGVINVTYELEGGWVNGLGINANYKKIYRA